MYISVLYSNWFETHHNAVLKTIWLFKQIIPTLGFLSVRTLHSNIQRQYCRSWVQAPIGSDQRL